MELEEIFKIWDRFDQSDATTMDLRMEGFHLKLISADPSGESSASNPGKDKPGSSKKDNLRSPEEDDGATPVKAPLVGTFYRASSPDAEAFVRIGQRVEKGTVIGIIEAMKLMNEVLSPVDGIVEDILVEEGSMVEYDQLLMKIKQEA